MRTLPLAVLVIACGVAYAGDATSDQTKKSYAELLYEKTIADNTKEAQRAYDAYLKALDAANVKVLKALEAAKTDLNDPKKGTLSIKERAAAIQEIEAKIEEVKKGALEDAVVAASSRNGIEKQTPAQQAVGRWSIGGFVITIARNGKWDTIAKDFGGTWRIVKGKLELTSTKGNNQVFVVEPKAGAIWSWNGGSTSGAAEKLKD